MKSSKESLKELVDFLIIAKKFKTQSELSLDAGYKEQTLTQAISKKTGHRAVIDKLKIIYRDLLKKSIAVENGSAYLENENLPIYNISELKRKIEEQWELIKSQQETILINARKEAPDIIEGAKMESVKRAKL